MRGGKPAVPIDCRAQYPRKEPAHMHAPRAFPQPHGTFFGHDLHAAGSGKDSSVTAWPADTRASRHLPSTAHSVLQMRARRLCVPLAQAAGCLALPVACLQRRPRLAAVSSTNPKAAVRTLRQTLRRRRRQTLAAFSGGGGVPLPRSTAAGPPSCTSLRGPRGPRRRPPQQRA